MTSYDAWLMAVHGRGSALAKALGVTRSSISNLGRRPGSRIPAAWIPTIVQFSGGELTHEDIIPLSTAARAARAGLLPKQRARLDRALIALGRPG